MTDAERLQKLIQSGHRCITIPTFEEDDATGLVRIVATWLARPAWVWSCDGGLQHMFEQNAPIPQTEDAAAALRHIGTLQDRSICVLLDIAPHLENPRTARVLRNLLRRLAAQDLNLVLINASDVMPPVVQAHTTRFELSLPDETEIEKLVRDTLRIHHDDSPIEINITRSGLRAIIRNLRGLPRRQIRQIVAESVSGDRKLDREDIHGILAAKRRSLGAAGLLEFVEAPEDLSQIGGLRRLKAWLTQRERSLSPEAETFGLTAPRGVLMLGVQGAGKSLCAKAIACAWQRPLLRMDVGALYDRYVGESERRLRDALHQAEAMAPIILWVDEIEKAFASAAARSTDGGLSQRMFGTLLTWMQEHRAAVFLVATANDIEALPPELLRKGRFDEIFFVDLPAADVRREIFAIHLKKRQRDPAAFDLDALTAAADGFSGAEIEQAIIAAMHDAFSAKQALMTEQIVKALRGSPPLSITMAERIAGLRAWAAQRCVPAD